MNPTRPTHHPLHAVCVLIASLAGMALPAAAAPPGKTLTGQVKAAYGDLETYRATLTFSVDAKSGRTTHIQRNEIYIAFDRGGGPGLHPGTRVMIDTPDLHVVVKDQTLYASIAAMPGRHVEQPLDATVSYDLLTQALVTVHGQFLLIDPIHIDLAFLLANNPIATISQDAVNAASPIGPDPDDPLMRPRLEFGVQGGKAILTIDPKTRLVVSAEIEMSSKMLPAGDHRRFAYEYEIESINGELPGAFDFDTSKTQSAPSLAIMQSGGAGPRPHPLVGQPAPDLQRKMMDDTPFDLDAVDSEIVVLELWASWAPDCRDNLRHVQTVADWANEEGQAIDFYAVNIGEDPATIQAYWQQEGLTLPILLDPDGRASLDFGAQGVPQTVVIKDDIIREVYVNGTDAETLQADLERLTEE